MPGKLLCNIAPLFGLLTYLSKCSGQEFQHMNHLHVKLTPEPVYNL